MANEQEKQLSAIDYSKRVDFCAHLSCIVLIGLVIYLGHLYNERYPILTDCRPRRSSAVDPWTTLYMELLLRNAAIALGLRISWLGAKSKKLTGMAAVIVLVILFVISLGIVLHFVTNWITYFEEGKPSVTAVF